MKNNKICLISGSTQGIGLSIAENLGKAGFTVIISSRREENSFRAEQHLSENNISYDYYMCNFNVRSQRKELAEYINNKYGKLDSLICCVSSNPYIGDPLAISEKEFDQIFKVNVKETFFTIVDFLDLLKKGKDPSILLVSSHSGYVPFPYIGIYSIAKSSLFSMTKILAKELIKFKIRINCVAPGFVYTKISNLNIYNSYAEMSFMKRLAMPHEIAGVALFFCSEDSSFITGEVFSINGGMIGRL
jgi:dehydrogenase/reductase SDR family member 4